ncbi:MAG TPA: non-homologous end-joining DNA ligase [Rudaea sp.]|jgi:bifunctional non-homologous end joining protein LigD|nr:non-homologous end-joining DNA ligase [Rudaea sp.]
MKRAPAKKTSKKLPVPADVVKLTHPDRVVFAEGYTKQDVADYYTAVMPLLLAAIRGRPLSIIRCPDGTGKGCFFQKHTMQGLKRVKSALLKEESGGEGTYLYVENAVQVLELVQFNAIEFHPWASTIEDTDVTDYLVFDLDPGPDVTWKTVVRAAELLRDRLGDVKLESFVRTSGGKGLHVVVPLRPAVAWADAREFAHGFASSMADERPDEFIATASKAQRGGVIFIDYLRNSRGATSVASYSLRSRAGAPVALPLGWVELRKVKSADAFTLRNVPARLKRQKRDPWHAFAGVRQSLPGKRAARRSKT